MWRFRSHEWNNLSPNKISGIVQINQLQFCDIFHISWTGIQWIFLWHLQIARMKTTSIDMSDAFKSLSVRIIVTTISQTVLSIVLYQQMVGIQITFKCAIILTEIIQPAQLVMNFRMWDHPWTGSCKLFRKRIMYEY